MNAGVASGLLLMAAGGLFGWYAWSHGSLPVWLFAAVLVGVGANAVGRWWGR